MSNLDTNPDIWTVKRLVDATSPSSDSSEQVSIPDFQRKLVWSKQKQEELIKSIKNGFPFGSLLLYEDIEKGQQSDKPQKFYSLIDGLQRTQALKNYTANPNEFFDKSDLDEIDLDISTIANALNRSEDHHDVIRREIANWIQQVPGFAATDGWGTRGLTRALIENILKIMSEDDKFIETLGKLSSLDAFQNQLEHLLETVKNDADIDSKKVPIIFCTGDRSELPTVFELLNSQGTALSRYEVFAAQWSKSRQAIANHNIIDAIWETYDALEEEGFILEVSEQAPDRKSQRSREYSLFEYLFGLGRYLPKEYKTLFKPADVNKPSSAGFNLVSACLELRLRDIGTLPEVLHGLGKDIGELEKQILQATQFVYDTLKPILSVKQSKQAKLPIYHSEYQIVSLIATAFKVMFDGLGDTERKANERTLRELKGSMTMHYLYDILREYWRSAGDVKLYEVVNGLRYVSRRPSKQAWGQVLGDWFLNSQMTLVHRGRYVKQASSEILLLKYIYAHQFTLMDNAQTYHVEHIIPVNRLTSSKEKEEKWPINAVGNLALLEKSDNEKKGNQTFKEYLNKQLTQEKIDPSQYELQLKEYEKRLICSCEFLPADINLQSYEEFLRQRFDQLTEEFFSVWAEEIPQA